VKQKGFFTKEQFLDVVRWKSPRPEKHYLSNSEESVVETSRKMLSTDSEDLKMSILDSLNGVSIAVASSLLTIVDPKNYGIIDIRVWQLLHKYDEVKTKPG
jgi:thermostable 8-oxoguanine DNA glycosylase